jgi:ADP-heptose:LPS heptosyltransferase
MDRNKFLQKTSYRRSFLSQINQKKYEVLINSSTSREFYLDDWICHFLNSKIKIASSGDLVNQTSLQRKIANTWYTTLISYDKNINFQFSRNLDFFKKLIPYSFNLQAPKFSNICSVNFPKIFESDLYNQPYVVFFIGAAGRERKWPIQCWLEIAEYLNKRYSLNILICGGSSELSDISESSLDNLKYVFNHINQISLIELAAIIKKSQLLISNESCAPHIGVSVEAKGIITISNANHYGRFAPYPKDIYPRNHIVWHPSIDKSNASEDELVDKYYFGSRLDISDISPKNVMVMIDRVLGV